MERLSREVQKYWDFSFSAKFHHFREIEFLDIKTEFPDFLHFPGTASVTEPQTLRFRNDLLYILEVEFTENADFAEFMYFHGNITFSLKRMNSLEPP